MATIDLIKKYPDVDPNILKLYKEAETSISFHEDEKELYTITIDLPKPPELHKIANFGKHPKDQKWKAPKLPFRLEQLVKKAKTLDRIWEELDKNQFFYREEIKFIKKQWYYVLNGYWIFINGVPTYIDGWHYFYIAWWNIDTGLPKYRSRDRKFFLFARHCYTTTKAVYPYRIYHNKEFRYFPEQDNAIRFCKEHNIETNVVEKGPFTVDMGRRTLFGFIYPKYRREGATYKAEVINYVLTMTHNNAWGGIQSMTDPDAKKVFQKAIIKPWKKLPFFFKPIYEGSTNPKEELSFTPPAIRVTSDGSMASVDNGLESKIDFAIADGSGYDGQKLLFHHHDEVGKFKAPLDIVDINSTIRECLSVDMGMTILGLGIKTSTVGKMDEGQGGDRFKQLCELSMYDYRNENGQTLSGFVVMFMPAEDGIVVDEFGNSVIEDPPKPIRGESGQLISIGGKRIVSQARKGLLEKGAYEELAKHKRQFPNAYSECFSTVGGQSKLPIGQIEYRLEELAFHNPTLVRGNLHWTGLVNGERVNELFGSDVEFKTDPLGKWYVSERMKPGEKNARIYDRARESWVPKYKSKRTLGIDPFKHDTTLGSRRSEGGGAVFYHHDMTVDPSPDFKEWKHSCRFTVTYSNRTFDKAEFFEDMLMTAIFCSCGVFPEYNIPEIGEWFIKKGYAEYLIFKVDFMTGKENLTPGQTAANNSAKEEMFMEYSTHLTRHVHREVHVDILNQCKKISGPKELKNYDLFAAGGWALIGSKHASEEINRFNEKPVDINDYFHVYSYQ